MEGYWVIPRYQAHQRKGIKMPNLLFIHHAKLLAHIRWQKRGNSDANYAQQANHHLISGYCLIFGAGAISWSSKKQNIITLSSTEAEYVGHTNTAKEILWI